MLVYLEVVEESGKKPPKKPKTILDWNSGAMVSVVMSQIEDTEFNP